MTCKEPRAAEVTGRRESNLEAFARQAESKHIDADATLTKMIEIVDREYRAAVKHSTKR